MLSSTQSSYGPAMHLAERISVLDRIDRSIATIRNLMGITLDETLLDIGVQISNFKDFRN